MRDVSDGFLAAVLGSNEPVVSANVFLGGELVRESIRVAGGQVEFDSTRDVEAHLSIQLVDEESAGSRLAEVIHAIGMQVNVRAGFDLAGTVETVSLGWFDVYDAVSVDAWEWFDWRADAVKTSSVVSVEALDLMGVVAASPFLKPQQPTTGADAWATIQDLCVGVVSSLDPGFAAKSIPAGVVFEWDRLDAIRQIAKLWDAFPVMTPDGQLTLATEDSGDVIDDFGVRLNVASWQDRSNSQNLHNGVTFLGKDPATGAELIGTAVESDGLARWGGDFGQRPLRAASDLMTTQAMVDAAAATRLATEIASRAVVQSADALWNPAIELRDRPLLKLPDRDVDSKILGYVLPLLGGPMKVTLRLPVTL
jgi:hypothetical protein